MELDPLSKEFAGQISIVAADAYRLDQGGVIWNRMLSIWSLLAFKKFLIFFSNFL